MEKTEIKSGIFNDYIKEAIYGLQHYELDKSYHAIMKALNENPNAPEPHNLLGIWYEFKRDNDLARKHYRTAYVLDPTYKPASTNLERVSTLFISKRIEVDFGEVILEEVEKDKMKENEKK